MQQRMVLLRRAKHYTAIWGIEINESTARRFKEKYLNKLKDEVLKQRKRQAESKEASDGEETYCYH